MKNAMRFDLHTHSHRSMDGRMTVEELMAQGRRQGLSGLAVCDHDLVAEGLPTQADFLLIPAVECSTEYGHLLGLFVTKPLSDTRNFDRAVEEIHAQGGLAVLAHPFEHRGDRARLTPIINKIDGIEVYNSRAERKRPQANQEALALARETGLRCFAGSDAHVKEEVGAAFVEISCGELTLEAVKAALLAPGGKLHGHRSLARHTARSQLTKRKKQRASLLSYLKWAAFGGKCVIEDLRKGKGTDHVFDR